MSVEVEVLRKSLKRKVLVGSYLGLISFFVFLAWPFVVAWQGYVYYKYGGDVEKAFGRDAKQQVLVVFVLVVLGGLLPLLTFAVFPSLSFLLFLGFLIAYVIVLSKLRKVVK